MTRELEHEQPQARALLNEHLWQPAITQLQELRSRAPKLFVRRFALLPAGSVRPNSAMLHGVRLVAHAAGPNVAHGFLVPTARR